MLPPLEPTTGHLPPGRYAATLDEIHSAFVAAPQFRGSQTRTDLWQGFLAYLAAWGSAEKEVGAPVLLSIWLAGSFVSSEVDPDDVDVTPVVSQSALDSLHGVPGMKRLRSLFEHRASVIKEFSVEPFVLMWSPMGSTLFPQALAQKERDALAKHGGLDSFWQRIRPLGPKCGTQKQTRFAERGYLEVVVR